MIKGKKCLGCGGCVAACHRNAISLAIDKNGYYKPKIDEKLCVSCGTCDKTCDLTFELNFKKKPLHFFVCQNVPSIERLSSSGGVFYSIAKIILDNRGEVYGAKLIKKDGWFECVHDCFLSVDDIDGFLGSKYIQSNISLIYKRVKKSLLEGKKVLFVGTPCQVNSLRAFLHKEYENLYCVDLLCYGTMSKNLFDLYINKIKNEHRNSDITNIYFRKKEQYTNNTYFSVCFEDGFEYKEGSCDNPKGLMNVFAKNISVKESCISCRFKSNNRVGDLTLGDYPFNLLDTIPGTFDKKRRVSLVTAQTKKGLDLLVKSGIHFEEINADIQNAVIAYKKSKKVLFRKLKYNLAIKNINKKTLL